MQMQILIVKNDINENEENQPVISFNSDRHHELIYSKQ
jgi:hypothetical protein